MEVLAENGIGFETVWVVLTNAMELKRRIGESVNILMSSLSGFINSSATWTEQLGRWFTPAEYKGTCWAGAGVNHPSLFCPTYGAVQVAL